eukprot:9485109-Pyramimonas_sp.AAC.1
MLAGRNGDLWSTGTNAGRCGIAWGHDKVMHGEKCDWLGRRAEERSGLVWKGNDWNNMTGVSENR